MSCLNNTIVNKVFSFIGRNTLIILEGHWILLQLLVDPYLKRLPVEKNMLAVLNCVVMFIILIPVIKIVNTKARWIIRPVRH